MTYAISQIIRDVKILLDLNICEHPLISPDNDSSLHVDSMIRAMLMPAALDVMKNADNMSLGAGVPIRALLEWREGHPGVGMSILPLPDDCLRLISVKLTDWHRPARILKETDAEYSWQSSPFSGIRGNPSRPLAFICHRPTGMVAELYGSNNPNGVGVEYAQYVPMPHLESDNTIRLPALIYHDILEQTAKRVADIFGNAMP